MNITFRDFISISEGKQVGTLYHFTRLGNLANMLDDSFSMYNNYGYVSFTRSHNLISQKNQLSQNLNNWGDDTVVRLSINGTKLSNKYKIEPFMDLEHGVDTSSNEFEERIKNKVNLENYIIQIDIVYGKHIDQNELEKELQKTKLYNKFKFNYVKKYNNLKKVK